MPCVVFTFAFFDVLCLIAWLLGHLVAWLLGRLAAWLIVCLRVCLLVWLSGCFFFKRTVQVCFMIKKTVGVVWPSVAETTSFRDAQKGHAINGMRLWKCIATATSSFPSKQCN